MTKRLLPFAGFLLALLPLSCAWVHPAREKTKLASSLLAAGRTSEAVALFAEVVAEKPADPLVHFNLGFALCAQGDYDRAIDAFQWALSKSSGNEKANLWMALGNARLHQGDEARAIEAYVEALRVRPESLDLKWNLELARRRLREKSGEDRSRLAREMVDRRVNANRHSESGSRAPSVGGDPYDMNHEPRKSGQGAGSGGEGDARANLSANGRAASEAASQWLLGVEERLKTKKPEGKPLPATPGFGGEPFW